MGAPCLEACSAWATEADICSPCDDYSFPVDLLDDMLAVSSDLLFMWSGRQFPGSCQDIVRPCARSTADPSYDDRWHPSWGWCGCNRGQACGCSRLSEITLGGYPLTQIDEVKVDGEVLASSRYRIDDFSLLVRLPDADGTNPGWPCCQKLDLASTEEDTFEVTFTYGQPPPRAGVTAAAALACELAMGCQPETVSKCRLSARVTSVTRQGVSMVLLQQQGNILDEIRVAIPEVGLFLEAYNPARISRRAAVWSPDIPSRVRRAGT